MPPPPTGVPLRDARAIRVLATAVVLISGVVLTGWFTGVGALTVLSPDGNTMKANTALCLLLLAVSMLLPRRGEVLAGAVLAISVMTAASWTLSLPVDLDQALVHVDGAGPHPARMAALTLVCLLVLSASRLVSRRRPTVAQALAALVVPVAFVALLGHTYGAHHLYSTGRNSTMAVVTAVALLLVALGLLASRSDGPVQWLLHGQDAGAMLLRRLLPVLVVVVPLLGYVDQLGRQAGWYDPELGLAIMVAGCLTLVGGASWFVARRLADHDRQLLDALATLSVVNHDLETRVNRRAIELEEERGRSAVLRDRNRIAADLHDHVIQTLFAVALQLQAESRRSDRPEPLVDASTQVDQAIRGLRSTIFELKRAGTAQQLESDLAEIVSVSGHSSAEVQLRTAGRLTSIPDEIAEHVVAAAREGLSNAVKHARADLISLEVDARGEELVVSVSDDGVGIDPSVSLSGTRNLRDRAERLGGTCVWTTNETGGTTLTWRVPLTLTPGLSNGLVATAGDGEPDTLPAALAAVCAAAGQSGQDGRSAGQAVVQAVRAALDADHAVLVAGDGPDQLAIVAACGLPDDGMAVGRRFDRHTSVSGHAMSSGQVLRLDNTRGGTVPSAIFGEMPFACGLVVPVLGHAGGAALVVGRAAGGDSFSDVEEHQALALASLMPLVLHRDTVTPTAQTVS